MIDGEEAVALAVEDFASFRFEALVNTIDTVGGIEIHVPHALCVAASDLLLADAPAATRRRSGMLHACNLKRY